MQNQQHILRSAKFLPLFITQFFGAFNDNLFKNAFLIWFTFDIAKKLNMNAQIMVTIASGLFVVPFFLFSALAGQIADKFEKSQIIRIIKIAEIIIMAFALIGFYYQNIYLLLLLVFLMGVHSTFFGPIKYSILPEALQNKELISGNALIEGGTFLAILLGTIMGGIVVKLENGIIIISIAVILFAVIGYIGSLFIPKTKISDPNLQIRFNIFTQSLKIINYAKKEHNVWLAIIGISWFWLIGLTFLSQFPIYTKNIINGNQFVVTLFLSIFSIGIGLGSIMCNKFLKGQINGRLVPFGSIGISIGILLFCLSSHFYQMPQNIIGLTDFFLNDFYSYLIIASLLIIAVFSGIYIVPLYAIMQHRSDIKYLSRIIAANNILNAFFMVASTIIIIALTKLELTILQIFLVIGISNIFVFCYIYNIINKNKKNYND